MKTQNIKRVSNIIQSTSTGLFLRYQNYTTHTGQHSTLSWTEDPFMATRLNSLLELDFYSRTRPEVKTGNWIQVNTTSTIEIII